MTKNKWPVNLPVTDFPMRAQLAQREPGAIDRWEQEDVVERHLDQRKDADSYILHDGPPYANGPIHAGHAINKVLKDIAVRHHAHAGYRAPYVPGWDCHGLPIELAVEKKMGSKTKTMSRRVFRAACRAYAEKQLALQKVSFRRLGIFCDWNDYYATMSPDYEANVVRAFATMWHRGHISTGVRPVYWCAQCRSSLAEAEVEYQPLMSPAIDVGFTDRGGMLSKAFDLPEGAQAELAIWTTTPWTIPSNRAICLHPEFSYGAYALNEERTRFVVLATSLAEACLARYGIPFAPPHHVVKGQALDGMNVTHPLIDRPSPLLLGLHVTDEQGTGAVHSAPAHGYEDFVATREHNLVVDDLIDSDGRFRVGGFAGLPAIDGRTLPQANTIILQALEDHGRLLAHEPHEHSYPHCWRHHKPLIWRATKQWFLRFENNDLLRDVQLAKQGVQWVPSRSEGRMDAMLENRPDWCLSRQRTWGVPIPLFVNDGEPHPQSAEMFEAIAAAIQKGGVECWDELRPVDFGMDDDGSWRPSTDVVDVWLESGVSHLAVLDAHPHLKAPADAIVEGSDQHRGWFQSTLITAIAMGHTEAPYKTCMTHGFVVDADGRKFAKSLGNGIDPEEIISRYGADVFRLWVASSDISREMVLDHGVLGQTSERYRRIRNTLRFLLGNLCDYSPDDAVDPSQWSAIDGWAYARMRDVQQIVEQALKNFQYGVAGRELHDFCNRDMGSLWLNIIKDRLYTMPTDCVARRSAQTVMFHVVNALLRCIAPIMPFTADEAWRSFGREDALILAEPYPLKDMNDPGASMPWDELLPLRRRVLQSIEDQRAAGALKSPGEAKVIVTVPDAAHETLANIQDDLRYFFGVSQVELVRGASEQLQTLACHDAKCPRCWLRGPDVPSDGPCARCEQHMNGVPVGHAFA